MTKALTQSKFYKEEEKTMRSGLGWQSLDPMEAVAAVHSINNKNLLLQIAYEARNPEARRLALIKIGDKGLMASFAQTDISPIVRRRVVRELDDIELVSRIADNDDDRSVRESACQRLAQLEARREKDIPHMKSDDPGKDEKDIPHVADERLKSDDPGTGEKDVIKSAEGSNRGKEKSIDDGSNGHEYVDLGLSVKWSAMNIGAAKASDHGDYYAWGEIDSKNDYSWSTYKHGTSADDLSKYSYKDDRLALQMRDDAAHMNWWGDWRMPTGAEWEELCDRRNCSWEWTSVDGTPGYRVTSKKVGYAYNSIFLPAGGYFRGCSIEGAGSAGYYWSSARNKPFADRALCLYFVPNFIGIGNNGFRNGGFSIRPVME